MGKKIYKKREIEELIDKDGAIIDGDNKPNQFQNTTGAQSTTDDMVKSSRQTPSMQGGYAWGGLFGMSAMGVAENIQKEKFIKLLKEVEENELEIGLNPELNTIIEDAPLFHRTLKYMIDMGNMQPVSGDTLFVGFYNLLKVFDFSTLTPEQKQTLINFIQ
jgi:hypothetical protein